ncbi:MAG TPA: YdcF family protein [Pyrinomonadaceae bacterium]|nr:YdcF family protein [Pyrinomonadaceae bacterium]
MRVSRAMGRARRWARVALVLAAAWTLVAWAAARALIAADELPPRADCIVVLSGASEYAERTRYAAELFHRGVAPKIVLTNDNVRGGWNSDEQRNPLFVENALAELKRAGVPAADIEALPQPVASTYDEAVRVRAYASEHGAGAVVVVTSPYHSRRARWTMRRVLGGSGVSVAMAPVAAGPDSETPPAFRWWLSARGWRSVAPEYPKIVYYWLRYG